MKKQQDARQRGLGFNVVEITKQQTTHDKTQQQQPERTEQTLQEALDDAKRDRYPD